MYLPTLALLLVSSTLAVSPCDEKWNRASNMFDEISNEVINYDHDISETCKHFRQYAAREIFGSNAFRLEVMVSGFDNAVWDVRIKHRVIYINGHYPKADAECDLTYVDIKLLPEFADTHAAAWIYNNGMFVVAFPFKYTLDSHQLCNRVIDDTLIHVRKGFPSDPIFL